MILALIYKQGTVRKQSLLLQLSDKVVQGFIWSILCTGKEVLVVFCFVFWVFLGGFIFCCILFSMIICFMLLYICPDPLSVQFQPQDDFEKAIPVSELRERAEKLRSDGPQRPDRVECMWPHSHKTSAPEGSEDMAADTRNWISDPLRPWIEDAVVELMESHCKKVKVLTRLICVCLVWSCWRGLLYEVVEWVAQSDTMIGHVACVRLLRMWLDFMTD